MDKLKECGFTLIELIIVVVIIGVLATLAVTHYTSYKEKTLGDEAIANLKLIAAAERIYRMEMGNYYASTGSTAAEHIADINTNLKLSLTAGTSRNWDYTTVANNIADPPTFCAQTTRTGETKTWRIRNTEEEPAEDVCP